MAGIRDRTQARDEELTCGPLRCLSTTEITWATTSRLINCFSSAIPSWACELVRIVGFLKGAPASP
jgi:hypothetical protein